MPINAGYEYFAAEKKYLAAKTPEEKIACLEEMIKTAPKHKSSENFVANLKQRLNKLVERTEKTKKSGKGTKKSIRKEGFQCVIVGQANVGKSSILASLTNAKPRISEHGFSTLSPEVGTMDYGGVKAQIVDLPAIESDAFDIGIVNTADCILAVITDFSQLEKIKEKTTRSSAPRIYIFSKIDLKSSEEKRKIEATLKSKKLNAVIFSTKEKDSEKIKEKIFDNMDVIRIYTKEPGKNPSIMPLVLPVKSSVKEAAESILKGFSQRVRETRITGPSGKFPNQRVGLSHILKDKDVVEFHTN